MTPGAGVDPKTVVKIGKRVRNRRRKVAPWKSMRAYARGYASHRNNISHPNLPFARQCAEWLLNKGALP